MTLRVAAALLGKELQHHFLALLGATVLVGFATVVTWQLGLQDDWITLLDAALGVGRMAMPAFALFVASRLVVGDHQDGTHEFLAALPIAPAARAAVRLVLGTALVQAVMLAVVLSTAVVASRREGVPLGFLVQLALQLAIYLYAWYGLSFGIAHLGRFRWLVWWLLLVGLDAASSFTDDPLREAYWIGIVRDNADVARLDPPWRAAPLALAWGTAGIAVGFAVATWRGGALLERWFRPTTAYQRAQLVGVGMAAMLATGAVSDGAPQQDPWAALPPVAAQRAEVRAAASPGSPLWTVAEAAARELDALGAAVGVERWPPVVVLRAHGEVAERPVDRAPGFAEDARARVLLVDVDAPERAVGRGIVREALVHRLHGLARWDGDAQWLCDGLAAWWLGADPQLLARATAADLDADWLVTRATLGPERAEAVAAAGLRALEAQAGGGGARRRGGAAGPALAPHRARRRLAAAAHGRAAPGLARRRRRLGPGLARRPARRLVRAAGPRRRRARRRDRRPLGRAHPDRAALEWLALDALQALPLPGDPVQRVVPEPDTRDVSLPADLRARAAARWVVEDPELGTVSGPWAVRSAP
ncbi:MAG: hypothetical protein R3F59_29120 [Myxococcota bacterium]